MFVIVVASGTLCFYLPLELLGRQWILICQFKTSLGSCCCLVGVLTFLQATLSDFNQMSRVYVFKAVHLVKPPTWYAIFFFIYRHKEEPKAPDSASSDEENEDGDFTVYECPGLAPVSIPAASSALLLLIFPLLCFVLTWLPSTRDAGQKMLYFSVETFSHHI